MTTTQQIERGRVFSADEIRAFLNGKTMFREVIEPQFTSLWGKGSPMKSDSFERHYGQKWQDSYAVHVDILNPNGTWKWIFCPHPVGSRIWVKEGWRHQSYGGIRTEPGEFGEIKVQYVADDNNRSPYCPNEYFMAAHEYRTFNWTLKPAPKMPRWAARLLLEVVSVKVERLQEISHLDAIAEGARCTGDPNNEMGKGNVPKWSMNGSADWQQCLDTAVEAFASTRRDEWQSNPWVWVYEVKRVEVKP
jgi:hypothetical protein